MSAQDYAVTNPYNPPNHNGRDRKMATGTAVDVAGTTIALSGNTGLSTGPHLHTQAGTDQACQNVVDPTPHEFQPGTVVALRTTDPYKPGVKGGEWGKYITIRNNSGMYVTYAHLSEIKVSIGQVVGGNVTDAEKLADIRLADTNETREAVYLEPRTDTNSGEDIRKRVRLVPGDVDNLLKDVGITPTQADYDALKGGPKDFVYYLQARLKAQMGGEYVPVGELYVKRTK